MWMALGGVQCMASAQSAIVSNVDKKLDAAARVGVSIKETLAVHGSVSV